VLFVTGCLFFLNEHGVTVFLNKALIVNYDSSIVNTSFANLIVVDTSYNNINVGDYILYYGSLDDDVLASSVESIDNDDGVISYNLSNSDSVILKNVIGIYDDSMVYPIIGGILSFLESRWGYFIFIVLPIFFMFVYEVFAIICEFSRK
jgi:hypothetical protein